MPESWVPSWADSLCSLGRLICQLPTSVSPGQCHSPVLPQCLCFHLSLSQGSCAVPGFALGAHNNVDFSKTGSRCAGMSSIPHLSLLQALQFCAPMANPNASSYSPFSQLPEEPSALTQDLQQAGDVPGVSNPQWWGRCWAGPATPWVGGRAEGLAASPACLLSLGLS